VRRVRSGRQRARPGVEAGPDEARPEGGRPWLALSRRNRNPPRSQRRQGMIVIDLGSTRPAVYRCRAAIAVGLMLLGPAAAAAQTLPRVEGPLTMEEAVDLARQ